MDQEKIDALFALRSFAPAATLSKEGDAVSGVILGVEELQQTSIGGDLLWWDDDKLQPKMQVVVTLQTDDHKDEDDDGIRRVFLKGSKGNPQSAFGSVVAAVAVANASLTVGGKLGIRVTGHGTATKKGFSPPKLHEAIYEAGE